MTLLDESPSNNLSNANANPSAGKKFWTHVKSVRRDGCGVATLMHASKAILNLPTSSLHLCSPFQPNRKVKIHHQFTSFPKQLGQDSPP